MRKTSADAPLVVSTDGTAGPYITVTTEQVEPVRQVLQANGIPVQVDEDAVLLDGRPALAVIELGPGVDVGRVQSLLDQVAAGRYAPAPEQPTGTTSPHELIVKCDPQDLAELIHRLESAPPAGWARRSDLEIRLRKMRAVGPGQYCFSQFLGPAQREVAVWLQARRSGELSVSSIIPLQGRGALEVEHYNKALSDFEATFIRPLTQGLKVHVFNFPVTTEPTLEDVLSVEAMRRLRTFSAAANRGNLHPLDRQRWNAFVARTHRDDAVLDPELLSAWLRAEGWPDEQRAHLVAEYEAGRALLSGYDEERVDA